MSGDGALPRPRLVTIGPGTNHDVVARAYLTFHGLDGGHLGFVALPEQGVAMILRGEADFLLLCSVHPDAARITGENFRRLFIVDTFISPSKTLAVLTRRGVTRPRSIGLFGPTRPYVDTSRWEQVVEEQTGSIVTVGDQLLRGEVDSALVYLDYAERHPERFEIDEIIGSPDDAWVVFGTERAFAGEVVASRDSAVARAIRAAGTFLLKDNSPSRISSMVKTPGGPLDSD
jgi:hypothetical protein